jgi:type VI secretion system secreted protein VgrG
MSSLIVQATRPLTIRTALAQDLFIVLGFEAREAISELYRFEVELMTQNRTNVAFDQLLGRPATITLRDENGEKRYFSGIVCSLEQAENMIVARDGKDHEFTSFRMSLVPRLWLLSRRRRSRIFQRKNVTEILSEVLAECQPSFELDSTRTSFQPRDYCVQYRETDLDFAMRLMEEEGIYFYCRHTETGHNLVLANTPAGHPELPAPFRFEPLAAEAGEQDRISSWRRCQEIRSGKYTLRDYHFELPANNLEESAQAQEGDDDGAALEIYDHPGGYGGRYDGVAKDGGDQADNLQHIFEDRSRTVGLRMQAEAAAALLVMGKSSAGKFTAGYKFQLQDHFSDNGAYVLTTVIHRSRQSIASDAREEPFRYENEFTCIPFAVPFRPQRITPAPVAQGTQTAVVVGPEGQEIFTDKYGRVKVQFHWDRDGQKNIESSCWVRVASPWAGKEWGAVHIPRIGDEVIVAFEEGDPSQPIIVGSVYNAINMPLYALPDNDTRTGIKTRSTPKGSGYNELRFEDRREEEEIVVHAARDLLTTVERDEIRTVKHDRSTTITGNETRTIQQGNETTKISLGKSQTEALQSIELKVGQSSILVDQMGVTIKGMRIQIEAEIQVQVKGMLTQINADALLIAKGGVVMIN